MEWGVPLGEWRKRDCRLTLIVSAGTRCPCFLPMRETLHTLGKGLLVGVLIRPCEAVDRVPIVTRGLWRWSIYQVHNNRRWWLLGVWLIQRDRVGRCCLGLCGGDELKLMKKVIDVLLQLLIHRLLPFLVGGGSKSALAPMTC
jgi:hypothetical protein